MTVPTDTHPEMARKQVELLRRATTAQRFQLARSLTMTAIELSRRAIRRARPGASERELQLEFVLLHYGADLAERLKRYLEERGE
jgi:hypothetical protein